MKRTFLICLMVFTLNPVFSQHIFKEKYNDCSSHSFTLEDKNAIAKINLTNLRSTISSGINEKTKSKLSGYLVMQIYVDSTGKSCVLSIDNQTNMTSSKINIKSIIDKNVIWETTEAVSAFIAVYFDDGDVMIKRMGLDWNTGLH